MRARAGAIAALCAGLALALPGAAGAAEQVRSASASNQPNLPLEGTGASVIGATLKLPWEGKALVQASLDFATGAQTGQAGCTPRADQRPIGTEQIVDVSGEADPGFAVLVGGKRLGEGKHVIDVVCRQLSGDAPLRYARGGLNVLAVRGGRSSQALAAFDSADEEVVIGGGATSTDFLRKVARTKWPAIAHLYGAAGLRATAPSSGSGSDDASITCNGFLVDQPREIAFPAGALLGTIGDDASLSLIERSEVGRKSVAKLSCAADGAETVVAGRDLNLLVVRRAGVKPQKRQFFLGGDQIFSADPAEPLARNERVVRRQITVASTSRLLISAGVALRQTGSGSNSGSACVVLVDGTQAGTGAVVDTGTEAGDVFDEITVPLTAAASVEPGKHLVEVRCSPGIGVDVSAIQAGLQVVGVRR